MYRKRGIVRLQVIALLAFMLFFHNLEAKNLHENKYYSARICSDDSDSGDCDSSVYAGTIAWYRVGQRFSACDDSYCQESFEPSPLGCWAMGVDEAFSNECGWAKVKEGTLIGRGQQIYSWSDLSYSYSAGYNGHDADCMMRAYNYDNVDYQPMLCADDHFWHECTSESKDTITWAASAVFQCLLENGVPVWKQLPGFDADHDTFTTTGDKRDCVDNPSDDPQECTELTAPSDCTKQTSKCAICINPDAKELAGDGVDNDCNSATSEDIEQNKAACENSDQNLQGKAFSFLDGVGCCGDDGLDDLGDVSSDGKNLCLTNKNNLVGYAGDAIANWGTTEKPCAGC